MARQYGLSLGRFPGTSRPAEPSQSLLVVLAGSNRWRPAERDGYTTSMHETWLKPNRRAIWFGCVPPLAVVGLGSWLTLAVPSDGDVWRWLGVALVLLGGGATGILLSQLRRPRIGYHAGRVLFYLRTGPPVDVPARVVEAFFLGQGPAALPGGVAKQQQTVNLVARLSQQETDWASRNVKPALGQWCGGYVTIRGAWCEPLDNDVVRRLNRRLKEVQTETAGK